ncbi:MAG: oligosaccharide flippase family protein, partial [Gammaproteobacteria bacterium]|nr:oligosaccharide flippase family protein [Gammaproteobacteria bacterium]
SLYSRDLNYRILLFIRLPAQIIGFIFTLYLIYIDVGIFALAWGSAVTIFLEFITSLLFRNRSYPLYPSFRYLKQILRFGIFNSGSTLLFRISTTAPDLIIGKLGSSVDVAMYSRGLGFVDFLSNFLIMGAKPIALPYLAQVRRSGGSLSDAYIASTSMLCTITWPALGFASIMSLQTLRVIFGDQWDAASPLVSYLTLWAGFRMTHTLSQSYLISTGNEKVMFFKEVAGVSLVIFAIYFAFPYGLVYVAAAMAIASFIEMLITMITLKYFADLKVTLFVKELIPVTFLTLVCWVSIVGFSELDWIKQLSDFIQLVVTGMINLAIWVLFLWAFRLRLFREIKSTFTKHSKNP